MIAGRLIVAAVVDEDTRARRRGAVKNWRADAAVVTEPTDLVVSIGHKGFSWVEIITEGRAAHGSRPLEGRDAIFRMGRVLSRLEGLNRQLQSKPPHPTLGNPSLHGSLIEGGRELSTYPDRCVLQMERRTVAGEPTNIALDEVEEILAELATEDPEFQGLARLIFSQPPYETPAGHELPRMLEVAVSHTGHATQRAADDRREGRRNSVDAPVSRQNFGPGGAGYQRFWKNIASRRSVAWRDALAEIGERILLLRISESERS